MLTRIGLPIFALVLIAISLKYLAQARERLPELPPPVQPARSPFPNTVAGAGMVEPQTENISVGSSVPGVVVEVMVEVGQKVKAGDPIFRLDDRELTAELEVQKAALADATAQLARLEAMPRQEELPPAEAAAREAKADWENWEQQWARGEELITRNAISQEEFTTRKQTAIQARERYNRAAADENLLKAGFEKADLQGLSCLVASHIRANASADLAHVVLPGSSYAEKRGSMINVTGRLQRLGKAINSPGNARDTWEIVRDLISACGGSNGIYTIEDAFKRMAAEISLFEGLTLSRIGDLGVQVMETGATIPLLEREQERRAKGIIVG